MYSLKFPDMFERGMSTAVVADHEATFSNTSLALLSDSNTMLGDPEFGSNLKKRLYSQNSAILRDLLIDDIYTAILMFIPQLIVNRNDIEITSDRDKVYATIRGLNVLDMEPDMFTISLTD